MLQDHSSRWSAAASPGGLIGLVLTILSIIALVAAALGLTDRFRIALDEVILYPVFGVAALATLLLIYLLISYATIGYRMDAETLTITWGLSAVRIPYEQIEAVDPADEVLGEQNTGWMPFWPGYYVGTRNTDIGSVRVIATLPPRRQILISRSNGEHIAISPERPLLFMEELARWHYAYYQSLDLEESPIAERPVAAREQAPVADVSDAEQSGIGPDPYPAQREEPGAWQQAPAGPTSLSPDDVGEPQPEPYTEPPYQQAEPERSPVPAYEPEPPQQAPVAPEPVFGTPSATDRPSTPEVEPAYRRDLEPEPEPAPQAPPAPEPVFGTSMPADQEPGSAQRFGAVRPEVAASHSAEDSAQSPGQTELEEQETEPLEVWFPERPPERTPDLHGSYQQFVDAGWTSEQQSVRARNQAAATQFSPPKPVILPEGVPRSEVLQPLTRVYRSEQPSTSPAIRPMLHRDPVALSFIGVGLATTVAMTLYILVQYDDIPPSLTLHWNVDGLPGRVGEPQEIWTLPLIAVMVLIANVGLAWSIAQFDRFAARLMLSSTLIVHAVTWVALLMILE